MQGIAFTPGGRAYSIEHGTDRDDEVNRLVAGAQLRLGPGPARRRHYDESRPMTDLDKFPAARRAVWSLGPADDRAVGGHVPVGLAVGRVGRAPGDGRAQGPAAARSSSSTAPATGDLASGRRSPTAAASGRRPGARRHLYIATDASPGTIFRLTAQPA